jgi:anti-sigma regulatory factor (Ser/Thr protein kinase)
MPHGFRVTPAPGSVAEARQQVISVVRGWHLGLSEDRLEDLRLLTSEVVTNALSHTSGACAVCVRWTGTRVRVEVTDPDPAPPQCGDATPDDESGRGLMLVSALSAAWGVDPDAAGKIVWFEISPDKPPTEITPDTRILQSTPNRRRFGPLLRTAG